MQTSLKSCIVRIYAPNEEIVGTGFLVSEDGLIVTCAHVIEKTGAKPGEQVSLLFYQADVPLLATVVPDWWDTLLDVSVLQLVDPVPAVQALQLITTSEEPGKDVRTFGYPEKAREGLWGKGKFDGTVTENGKDLIQLSSDEITLGFSGSPLYEQGSSQVIGMVMGIREPDSHGRTGKVAFAIPSETIVKICSRLTLQLPQPSGQPEPGDLVMDTRPTNRRDWLFDFSLPSRYVPRMELLDEASTFLLETVRSAPMTSGLPVKAFHGTGGIGKSVLVRALCDIPQVRERFPDGILWATLGQDPDITGKIKEWVDGLGGRMLISDPSVNQWKAALKQLLQQRRCLLVVDDVWQEDDLGYFLVQGDECQLLVTARNRRIVDNIGALVFPTPLMSQGEAVQLLEEWADGKIENSPEEEKIEIVERLARLPLAIKLAGGHLRNTPLSYWLREYRELRDLDQEWETDNPQKSLYASIQLSMKSLPESAQQLYTMLAIFPEDEIIPETAVFMLWKKFQANLSDSRARLLLDEIVSKALLEPTNGGVFFHDVLHQMVREKLGDKMISTHRLFLQAFKSFQSGDGWHTAKDDGYLFDHLVHHFLKADALDDALGLFNNQNWLNTRLAQKNQSYVGYISDVNVVLEELRNKTLERTGNGVDKEHFASIFRLLMIRTSIISMADKYPPAFILRAYDAGLWSLERTVNLIRQISSAERKINACLFLMERHDLGPDLLVEMQETAIQLIGKIDDTRTRNEGVTSRSEAIDKLLPFLTLPFFERIIEAVFSLNNLENQARLLKSLFPKLPLHLQQKVIARTQSLESKFDQYKLLSVTDARKLAELNFDMEINAVFEEVDEWEMARTIRKVGKHLNAEQAQRLLIKAHSFKDREAFFYVLPSVVSYIDKTEITNMLQEIRSLPSAYRKIDIVVPIMPLLDQGSWEEIISELVEEIVNMAPAGSAELYPHFLHQLGPYLSAKRIEEISIATLEKGNDWLQAATLAHFGTNIPPSIFRPLLTSVLNGPEYLLPRVLNKIRDTLDTDLKEIVINRVIYIQNERYRFECLKAIVPIITQEETNLALSTVSNIQDISIKVGILVSILPNLAESERRDPLNEALDLTLKLPRETMEECITTLLPYLDAGMLSKVQSSLLHSMDDQIEYIGAQAALLRRIQSPSLTTSSELLEMIRLVEVDNKKASTLQEISYILDKAILPQAINITCDIKDELYRLQTFDHYLSRLGQDELDIILNNIINFCSTDRKAEFLPYLANFLEAENKNWAIQNTLDSFDNMTDEGLMGISARYLAQHFFEEEKEQFIQKALDKIQSQEESFAQMISLSHLAHVMGNEKRREIVKKILDYSQSHIFQAHDCLESIAPILEGDTLELAKEMVMAGPPNWSKSSMIILLLPKIGEEARKDLIDEVLHIAQMFRKTTFLRNKHLTQILSFVTENQKDVLVVDGIQAARELSDGTDRLMALHEYIKYSRDPDSLNKEIKELFIEQLLKCATLKRSFFLNFCIKVSPLFQEMIANAISSELREIYVDWKWY